MIIDIKRKGGKKRKRGNRDMREKNQREEDKCNNLIHTIKGLKCLTL